MKLLICVSSQKCAEEEKCQWFLDGQRRNSVRVGDKDRLPQGKSLWPFQKIRRPPFSLTPTASPASRSLHLSWLLHALQHERGDEWLMTLSEDARRAFGLMAGSEKLTTSSSPHPANRLPILPPLLFLWSVTATVMDDWVGFDSSSSSSNLSVCARLSLCV